MRLTCNMKIARTFTQYDDCYLNKIKKKKVISASMRQENLYSQRTVS